MAALCLSPRWQQGSNLGSDSDCLISAHIYTTPSSVVLSHSLVNQLMNLPMTSKSALRTLNSATYQSELQSLQSTHSRCVHICDESSVHVATAAV